MKIFIGYLLTFTYIFLVIGISAILKEKNIINEEDSRKIVHIFVSLSFIIMYIYLKDTIHFIIPPLIFILLNYLSYKKNIFTAMERKQDNTLGTVYYAFSLFIMALLSLICKNYIYSYAIGIFCMAFADGLAPIISSKIKSKKLYRKKTVSGTLTVFIMTLLIVVIINKVFLLNYDVYKIILVSFVSAILELFSRRGLDNLTLPLGLSLLSYLII